MSRRLGLFLAVLVLLASLFVWITETAEEKGRVFAELEQSRAEIQQAEVKYEQRKKEERRREKIFTGANASRDDILELMRQNVF